MSLGLPLRRPLTDRIAIGDDPCVHTPAHTEESLTTFRRSSPVSSPITVVVCGVLAWGLVSGTAFAQSAGRLGGSAILHLMAAHPKVVAALGIVATVDALITANGPHNALRSGRQMRRLERTVAASHMATDEDVAGAADIAALLADEPNEEIEPLVREVLRQCGAGCATLTPEVVMHDEELLHSALTVWELEQRSPDIRSLRGSQIAGILPGW